MGETPFADLIKAAAEAKYTVVPAADYIVVCKDATPTRSSTNKDMIKLKVGILVGPYAGNNILGQQTLSPENPQAVVMFLKFLASFGLDEDFLKGLPATETGGPNIPAVCAALKGKISKAEVDVHEWNEEDRNGLQKFKTLSPDERAAGDAALASGAAGVPGGTGAASDPFAASAPAPANDVTAPGKSPF